MYVKFNLPKWLIGVTLLHATAEIHLHSAGWWVLKCQALKVTHTLNLSFALNP